MSTYSAVLTTGIYCRPECSARPLPKNVHPYASAAAAEAAGFRACLRCRPYRTDQPLGWVGPELVCRAVQLILDGALDVGHEDDLGQRLAVSPRHLRRVFVEHLGVTPDQLARSRRVHFARRLLDDTDLSITDVAFASGFGSVRQLNRACVDTFHGTPRELRARRRKADRLVADGGLTLRMPFTSPLAWPEMLAYFAHRAIVGVEQVDLDAQVYRRTIVVDGDPGVIEISAGGDDHLLLRAHLPHWEGLIHVVQRARRIFDLDADLTIGTHALRRDRVLGPLLAARPGLRMPGAWDPFEIGVRAIVGQQVSVAGASTITARLVERHGTLVPGLEPIGLSRIFPRADHLAGADLTGLGLTNARIAAIRTFAAAVVDDRVRLDRSEGLDTLVASITALPGLGPWTAHYLALRLGEPDAFPVTDLGLRRAVASRRGDAAVPPSLVAEAEAWRPPPLPRRHPPLDEPRVAGLRRRSTGCDEADVQGPTMPGSPHPEITTPGG
jgi:AraC family transcriptional regulator of adaptative response / DNA-3-methyladenine glycosylase II